MIPFFAYPAEVRTIIYTTNAIESLHMRLRKIAKNRGHFPSDEAATKLQFLALQYRERLADAVAYPEAGCQPIRHHVRRALHEREYLITNSGPHTEFLTGPYPYSVRVGRSQLNEPDSTSLKQIDLSEALAAFNMRWNMTATGISKPVVPLLLGQPPS